MIYLTYMGFILLFVGILWSVINYIFHMPTYRPSWFDMQTMMRLIELNLVFTAAGVILLIYSNKRSGTIQ